MSEKSKPVIMYRPEDAGKQVRSSRGNLVTKRKYHMSPEEMETQRAKWLKDIEMAEVPASIRKLAHPTFFNPFRHGIYYAQIQALYVLGANQEHELSILLPQIQEIMMSFEVAQKDVDGKYVKVNAWKAFREKAPRGSDSKSKDIIGRIQENFIFFQRLSALHPCGYKLRQVGAALDLRREARTGLPNGLWYYKLHTFDDPEQAWPTRDFSKFDLTKRQKRFMSYRFIGRIITANKTVFQGAEEAEQCSV